MIERLINTNKVRALFGDWQEATLWACLDGLMGSVHADHVNMPKSALAYHGCFCFLAGEPNKELLMHKPDKNASFEIMVPQSDEWAQLIQEIYPTNSKRVTRYALKKEENTFDREYLQKKIEGLNTIYTLKLIDEGIYEACLKEEWSRDLVGNYENYDTYNRLGLGVVILKEKEIIAGASSYSTYNGGIDIEIDTKETYRRQGLASVCGSKLILECLERNMNPCWDAQNIWSRDLAVKLGYQFEKEYTAFEVWER